MAGKIFLFVGIILVLVGLIIYQSDMRVHINGNIASPEEGKFALHIVGAGVGGLGGIFLLLGLANMVRGSKKTKRNMYIMQTGVNAEGTITFVDKNYTMLVNKKPIYSIVEYTYQDKVGTQHTRRVDNLNSDLVIRRQLQVGGKIPIKYAVENPAESVMVL